MQKSTYPHKIPNQILGLSTYIMAEIIESADNIKITAPTKSLNATVTIAHIIKSIKLSTIFFILLLTFE